MSNLLLALPLRATGTPDNFYVEAQAHNGLRLWLKHFDNVTLVCLLSTSAKEPELPISIIGARDRLRVIGLPEAWLPHRFFLTLPRASRILSAEIDKADHLLFAIGGLWGDWPSIGALIASKKRRKFAVWTDHVESDAHRLRKEKKRGLSRVYTSATAIAMGAYERFIIRRSTIGLFHGADCFSAYESYCPNSHLVHDIHIGLSQHISHEALQQRLIRRHGPLRLVYAGRLAPEKGALDWVRSIALAKRSGVSLEATWFGTGPDLKDARELASALGAPIMFAGPIPHRDLLDRLKTFDAFVFCHKTLESPRCLIEALACGLPIIGYSSKYPQDLVSRHGGAILTPTGSPYLLAQAIASLRDELKLRSLSEAARLDGSEFSDEAVFSHRSNLIKSISLVRK